MSRRVLLVVGMAVLLFAEPALAESDPKLGKTALVNAVSGTVKVEEKGESGFSNLGKSPRPIPMGSVIDATRGKVRVRTAGKGRGLDEGTFWKGSFGIRQDKREAVPEMVLQGGSGDVVCPAPAVLRQLWGESNDAFRTVGSFSGVEVKERKTRWLTEDLCDGTRTSVKSGKMQAYDGPVVTSTIHAGTTIQHFCDPDGVEPVSRFFCTMIYFAPALGTFGGGIVTLGDATSYDQCVTDPAGVERCETFPLSEPFDQEGHRLSVTGCSAPGGPGAHLQRWLIDGVQIGPQVGFTSERPPGEDCIHRP